MLMCGAGAASGLALPEDLEVMISNMLERAKSGEVEQAMSMYSALAIRFPLRLPHATVRLARQRVLWSPMLQALEDLATRSPNSAPVCRARIVLMTRQQRHRDAIRVGEEFIAENGGNRSVRLSIADCALALGDHDKVREMFDDGLGAWLESREVITRLAEVSRREGRFEEAVQLLLPIIGPNAPPAAILTGARALAAIGDANRALEILALGGDTHSLLWGEGWNTPNPEQPSESPIPKTIVQYWEPLPPPGDVQVLMNSWKRWNPEYRYILGSSADLEEAVEAAMGPHATDTLRRCSKPAQRSDIFRYAHLYLHGGVYVDADHEAVSPLGRFALSSTQLLLSGGQRNQLHNAFMAAVPGMPVLLDALAMALEHTRTNDRRHIYGLTGPRVLQEAMEKALTSPAAASLWIEIIPRQRHAIFQCMHSDLAYRLSDAHWNQSTRSDLTIADGETS